MSYRTNLDKLMQMATLDQLNYMMQQLNTNINTNINTNTNADTNTNKDILSLPIVQKVIIAYEEELKLKQTVESTTCKCNCRCKDIEYRFDDILSKHDEVIFEMERKIDNLTNVINTLEKEKTLLNVADISRGIQLKLSSFPGFIKNRDIIDLTSSVSGTEDEPIIKIESETLVTDQITVDTKYTEENITLRVEEQYHEQEHTVELDNIISTLESYDVDNESIEEAVDEDDEEEEALDEDDDEEEEALDEDDDEEEAVDEDDDEEEALDEAVVEQAVVEQAVVEEAVVEEAVVEEAVVEEAVVEEAVDVEEDDEEESDEEVGTEEEQEDVKDESEPEEDVEEEVFEIEIDDVTYFATDEENGILYEVDKNGEVGKQVGIIKDGEPIFS